MASSLNYLCPNYRFDVDSEIAFIDEMAAQKKIIAIGECGLDKYYLTDNESMQEQERVLRSLMQVPSIDIHSISLTSRLPDDGQLTG
jgi:Tat protein secretion system quality control protein TatD with DNase activity